MKKKHNDYTQISPSAIIEPYLQVGEMITHAALEVFDADDLVNSGKTEEERADILTACAGTGACSVRIFGRGTEEEQQISLFRVIYRASAEADIFAVIPTVVLPSEAEHVRVWASCARNALREEGIAFGKLRAGIEIAAPSAAILSDLLAPMVDFFVLDPFSLMHALDAESTENISVHSMPESVVRCIKMTCCAARREGIPVLMERMQKNNSPASSIKT